MRAGRQSVRRLTGRACVTGWPSVCSGALCLQGYQGCMQVCGSMWQLSGRGGGSLAVGPDRHDKLPGQLPCCCPGRKEDLIGGATDEVHFEVFLVGTEGNWRAGGRWSRRLAGGLIEACIQPSTMAFMHPSIETMVSLSWHDWLADASYCRVGCLLLHHKRAIGY